MATDPPRHDPPETLPAHRAFVVHFAPPLGRGRFAGRVEHLTSGRAIQFGSLRALHAFFRERLAAGREP